MHNIQPIILSFLLAQTAHCTLHLHAPPWEAEVIANPAPAIILDMSIVPLHEWPGHFLNPKSGLWRLQMPR